MKYSANYSNNINLTDFDEIIIRYEAQEAPLLAFLQEHSNQHIVLEVADIQTFEEEHGWETLNHCYAELQNFSVKLGANQPFQDILDNAIIERICANLTMPYFFGFFATNCEQLQHLLDCGASQVYIAEDLCFNLTRAKRLCAPYSARLRAFPNVAQASVKTAPALTKFFIRPEDVDTYSDCIDTLEFWGPLDRQETLLRIYKKGIWFGDLNDLILDLNLSFDSRRIIPAFARFRKDCQRECMKNGRCEVCDRVYKISEKMQEKDLLFIKKKTH